MQGIVDIGNSYFKIASFKEKQLVNVDRYPNTELSKINILIGEFDKVIVSSVIEINKTDHVLKNNTTLFLNNETKLPISIEYNSRESLGKDRIANAVASASIYPNKNVLTIDAGTCITYDLVTKTKQFIGGSISPGLQMRLNAMHKFTGKLPQLSLPSLPITESVGKSTNDCMLNGAVIGAKNEIVGFIEEYKQLFDQLTVVLCGGDSKYLKSLDISQKNSIFADQFFTLKGLNEILLYNI